MIFNYQAEVTYAGEIEIENIGEFALLGWEADTGFCYLMIVNSTMGYSNIFIQGPFLYHNSDLLPTGFKQQYFNIPYNEGKIMKQINSFLSNGYKGLSKAELVDFEEGKNLVLDMNDWVESHMKSRGDLNG